MAPPRNNLSRHPSQIRYRVYALHYEGRTAAEINLDPEVAESVRKTGYRLHGNTLTAAFRRADGEYRRYVASREAMFASHEADRLAQHVIAESDALETVTDVARYELAREIKELIRTGPGIVGSGDDAVAEDPVERVERLTRALSTISKSDAEKMRRLLDHSDAEKEILRSELAKLRGKLAEFGLTQIGDVADEMDRRVGLK